MANAPPADNSFDRFSRCLALERDPAAAETELALLPTFDAFASAKSFASAAVALNLTRAAVHHRVATLQAVIGTPLYRRTRGTIFLTDAGVAVQRYAREVLGRRREFLRAALAPSRARLACSAGLFATLLTSVVASFERQRPGDLDVMLMDDDAAICAVREDRADLAVVATHDRPRGLPGRILLRAPTMVAAPAGHAVHRARELRAADLASFRVFASGSLLADVVQLPSVDAALACADAGLGIAIVESYQRVPPSLRLRVVRDLAPRVVRLVHTPVVRVLDAPFELRRSLFEQFGPRNKS